MIETFLRPMNHLYSSDISDPCTSEEIHAKINVRFLRSGKRDHVASCVSSALTGAVAMISCSDDLKPSAMGT